MSEVHSRRRVGIVDFLNARPLAWGFREGRFRHLFDESYHRPSAVARMLAAGELDIGLIPSIETQRIPGLRILPGPCVASTHEVRSVLLISRGPVREISRIRLDRSSRTSAALVQILLEERYGVQPEILVGSPPLEDMLQDSDAALVIGDPALHVVPQDGDVVLDLAAEWKALTGRPFVFAVWAVRESIYTPELTESFEESLARGLASLDRIAEDAAHELGLPIAEMHEYLKENLSYHLGPEEWAGLEEFFARARQHGLVPQAIAVP